MSFQLSLEHKLTTHQDNLKDAIAQIDPWVREQREQAAEDEQFDAMLAALPKTPWLRLRLRVKTLSQVVWLRWTVLAVISAAIGVAVSEIWNSLW